MSAIFVCHVERLLPCVLDVGVHFFLQLMTSEDAYRLAQEKRPVPVVVSAAEDLIAELEEHLSSLSPAVGCGDANRRVTLQHNAWNFGTVG